MSEQEKKNAPQEEQPQANTHSGNGAGCGKGRRGGNLYRPP